MSTLMFWNKQNGANNQNSDQKTGKKNWLHTPDVLVNGHVAYPVKFLGSTPVDQPKGIEVVKEAIRRLQFSQQLKKAEGGNNVKTKKVEITVSINGVAIQKQENKVQVILHQFPLHKISYCADEKGSKKFFSFIAKAGGGSNNSNLNNSNGTSPDNSSDSEVHECFVFISNKLASDITLTIGQAFDLAYRRYISESSKSGDNNTDLTKLQLQNKHLENSLSLYQQRLKELSEIVPKFEMDKILGKLCLKDICDLPQENGFEYESNISSLNSNGKSSDSGVGLDILSNNNNNDSDLLIETSPKNSFAPIVPPRNFQNQLNNTLDALRPSVGTKLEGLLLNSDSDSDFDPRATESDKIPESNNNNIGDSNNINDLFGFEPPKTIGQQLFTIQNGNQNSFSITNGSNGNAILNGMPSSPPPLLAPPPKAAIPRRTITPNKQPNSQDLFGSTPFSPFDETPIHTFGSTDFAIDMTDTSDNPFKPLPTVPMNTNSGSIANTTNSNITTPNFVLSDLSAFANNLDKLDTILIKNNYDNDETNSINQQNTSGNSNLNGIKKLNPFHKANVRSKSPSLNEMMIEKEPNGSGTALNSSASAPNNININNNNNNNNNSNTSSGGSILSSPKKVNPFSRTDSFLNRNLKYDSFKNAIDSFETTMYSPNSTTIQNTTNNHSKFGGGLLPNINSNINNNNNNSNDDKLNFYSASLNFNEFSNRLIDSDLNSKNNFTTTTTNNNNFGTAFTLESLDPLRK